MVTVNLFHDLNFCFLQVFFMMYKKLLPMQLEHTGLMVTMSKYGLSIEIIFCFCNLVKQDFVQLGD